MFLFFLNIFILMFNETIGLLLRDCKRHLIVSMHAQYPTDTFWIITVEDMTSLTLY